MSEIILNAEVREATGKGTARQLRVAGRIPAVMYGHKTAPRGLSVVPTELYKAVSTDAGLNALIHLKVTGGEDATILVRDLQVDPIRRTYVHADFLQVTPDEEVRVKVPVVLTGKAEGVKDGGILQQIIRVIEVYSKAKAIPRQIEFDVSNLKIGDSLHLKDLLFPEGVRPSLHINVTIAACVPPEKEEERPAETAAAGAAPAEGAAAGAAPAEGQPAAGAPAAAAPAAAGDKKKEKK